MNRIGRNLSIILRAERLIARRHMAVLRNQTGMLVFAALVGGIGLVMLNLAGFLALKETMSPQLAAFLVALANMVLALVLVALALKQSAEPELEPVTELRDLAIEDLEAELQGAVGEARDLARDLAGNVARMARDPFGTALPAMLIPLLTNLLRATRKK